MPNSELRIIAGELKNQKYLSPNSSATHPMSEKLKSAIFNILGDIEGLSVLDAFSGSGGIGLEAASRGAKDVTLIDSNLNAQKTANDNIQKLNLIKKVKLLRMSVQSWTNSELKKQFNIIIADPPYDYMDESLIFKLAEFTCPGGIFVLSLPATTQPYELSNFKMISNRIYGNSQLIFYQKPKP
jgi:16S rRNA (guanine(966)-N(2))-methyltransferase RsmD